MVAFYEEYNYIIKDYRSRNNQLTKFNLISKDNYEFIHTLLDDKEDNMWYLKGFIKINENLLITITLAEIAN